VSWIRASQYDLQRKIQQDATVYQHFIIPYLYKAEHVSGDTQTIIRSLKLHWQPLVFYTWKVVRRVVGGRCQAQCVPDNVHQEKRKKNPTRCKHLSKFDYYICI
jgi:hypothetical protein